MKAEETRCHDCPYVENSALQKLKNLKQSKQNMIFYPKVNGTLFVRNQIHDYSEKDIDRFISFEYHCSRISGRIVKFTKRGFILAGWKISNLNKERLKDETEKMFEEAMKLQTMTTYGMYSNPPQMPISNSDDSNNTDNVDSSKVNYIDTDSFTLDKNDKSVYEEAIRNIMDRYAKERTKNERKINA